MFFNDSIDRIRKIASPENKGGYARLIQFILIMWLIILFIFICIYYWRHTESVSTMGVILTVLVGWMGMIIGRFFGERIMGEASEHKTTLGRSAFILGDYKNKLNKLEEIIMSYEKTVNELIDKMDSRGTSIKSRKK